MRDMVGLEPGFCGGLGFAARGEGGSPPRTAGATSRKRPASAAQGALDWVFSVVHWRRSLAAAVATAFLQASVQADEGPGILILVATKCGSTAPDTHRRTRATTHTHRRARTTTRTSRRD